MQRRLLKVNAGRVALYRVVVGVCAAAAGAGGGCNDGLIQHAWTRPLRLSAALGSIVLACRTRQRNVTWIWPLGQPNRSYRSRWRKAVSRSSRQSRLTTRRPSHTHSGLPAGPFRACCASANSSIFCGSLVPSFALSLALSLAPSFGAADCCSAGLVSLFWAEAGEIPVPVWAATSHRAAQISPASLSTRYDISALLRWT